MNNQIIQLESYRLIRKKARDMLNPIDDATLGSYVRGVVDLQTELYGFKKDAEKRGLNDNED